MKDYGIVKSNNRPQEIEITENSVIIASNIEPYEEQDFNGQTVSGYKYNYKVYTKDEYLMLNIQSIQELEDELSAAKVLLGLEEE